MRRATAAPTSLTVVSEAGPNSFDPIGVGVNRNSIQITWNVYDRLLRFGTKQGLGGASTYDYFALEGEAAEAWEVSPDATRIVFHLRKGATFHDGAPVTARDVKWSLDRVVSLPIGKAQFATGSLTAPEQFVALDDTTFQVSLPRADRFALPNLALTFPIIVNSEEARRHAGADDPWATAWLKTNVAGGGPFRLESYAPGEGAVFARNEAWRNGAAPALSRVIWRVAPTAQLRRATLQRGDADLAQDVSPQDAADLAADPALKVVGAPMTGVFQFIAMNCATAPFDNVKVRRAIAAALPYDAMFQAALFGRGRPLFGPAAPDDPAFPQPLGTATDLAKARALLAEAGLPNGFDTTFTYELSLASIAEPVALLAQEALGKIGVRVTIDKTPAGQLGARLQKKEVPFYFEASAAFLADPDYFFRIFYTGPTRWNFGSYANAELAALVERTRFETDHAAYARDVRRMIELAKDELPIILLWQPALDVAMRRRVEGMKLQFHRQLDLRTLSG
ncbi:MAG: ABC transporter substrate-binding protein [Rhizobiales bacterium]|nr:ABC transporter substrate-binding protein [Hyphomicrobiales bacterium]